MANPMSGISGPSVASLLSQTGGGAKPAGDGGDLFRNLLLDSVAETQQMELGARELVEEHLAGGEVTSAEAFTAVKKADLALRMMLQVRNKLLEAYDEVKQMRM